MVCGDQNSLTGSRIRRVRGCESKLILEVLEDRLALTAISPAPALMIAPTPQVQSLQKNAFAPILVADLMHLGPVAAAAPLATAGPVGGSLPASNRLMFRGLAKPFIPLPQSPFGAPRVLGAVAQATNPVSFSNISGLIFADLNGDGIRQPIERPLPGETVLLEVQIDGDWTEMVTTTTDDNGRYIFSGLPSGTYRVRVVAPEEHAATKAAGPVIVLTGEEDKTQMDLGVGERSPGKPSAPEKDRQHENGTENRGTPPDEFGAIFFRLIDRVFGERHDEISDPREPR